MQAEVTNIAVGTRLGRYEIQYQLGAGGMGEVYYALDVQLGRPVALKLLPASLTDNKDRLHRFAQEAKLTSALNHPNILTIYDIGQQDSTYYFATEFIDGCTLRQHLAQIHLPLDATLDISVQVVAAVAAAHQAGIIHRDIKPENIMLRPDGYVKVLDFGLAKIIQEQIVVTADPSASTGTHINTDPGTVLGTVAYMSPEQLRGQAVDARTDVWSLGVIVYELVTRRAPFDRATRSDAIAAILDREPTALADIVPEAPAELQRILTTALQKDRERRYSSASALLSDLQQLKQSLTSGAVRAIYAAGNIRALTDVNTAPLTVETADDGRPRSGSTRGVLPKISVTALVGEFNNHGRSVGLILTGLVLLGIIFSLYLFSGQPLLAGASPKVTFTALQLAGDIKEAVISPDGKHVAAIHEEAGLQSLWLRHLPTTSDLQVVPPAEGRYKGLAFSADEDYVYYLKEEGNTGALYRVSTLGGNPRRVIPQVDTPVTFSPDGNHLAFVRQYPEEGATALIIANSDGTEEKKLARLTLPQSFNLSGFYSSGPAWSPDGRVIVCLAYNMMDGSPISVVAVQVGDGAIKLISTQRWTHIERLAWMSDGRGLVINAIDQSPAPFQLWLLQYPQGGARKITDDPNSYVGLSMTRDGSTLLTTKLEKLSMMWTLPLGTTTKPPSQIAFSEHCGLSGLAWTPTSDIVCDSSESGSPNLWLMSADGHSRRQLTFDDQPNVQPTVSPDGRYIVFASYRTGRPHLWRMEADGTNAQQLTNGSYEDAPQFSQDGCWVVYHSSDPDKSGVWKISIDGSVSRRLTDKLSTQPAISPDGRRVACFSRDRPVNSPWHMAVIPSEGGESVATFNLPEGVNPAYPGLRWMPDGHSIIYVVTAGGVSNIWSQDLLGKPPKQLTDFKENQIFSFALSPDTGELACVRGRIVKEFFLVKNF